MAASMTPPGDGPGPPPPPGSGTPGMPQRAPARDPVFDLGVRFWVDAQRAWLSRFPGVKGLAGDGHYLLTVPPIAVLSPLAVVVAFFLIGAGHVGFEITWSENLIATAVLLAVGAISGVLGALAVAAMWLGDLLLGTSWDIADLPTHLVQVRLPQLITYLLLAVGVVAVPRTGRTLALAVARARHLPSALVWPVSSMVVLIVAWIGTRTWTAAAPLLIRPRFTWPGGQPTVAAIAPLQAQAGVLIAAALIGVLIRQAWLGTIGVLASADDVMVRAEARARGTDSPVTRDSGNGQAGEVSPSTTRLTTAAVTAAVLSTLIMAGILEHWWLWVLSFVVFLGLRLLRSLRLPGVSRYQEIVARVPLVLRLVGLWLLARVITNALSNEQIGSYTGMALTVLAGAALIWVVFPGQAAKPDHHSGGMGPAPGPPPPPPPPPRAAAGPALLLVGLVLLADAFGAAPAVADNCGTFLDCFNQSNAAAEAAFGLVLLSLLLDFVPIVGTAKGWIETVTGRDLITGEQLSAVERALGIFGGWGDLLGLAARHGDTVASAFGWGRHMDDWAAGLRHGDVPTRPRATAGSGGRGGGSSGGAGPGGGSGRGGSGSGRGDGGAGSGGRGGDGPGGPPRDGGSGGPPRDGDGPGGPPRDGDGPGGDPGRHNGRGFDDFDADPPDGMSRQEWYDELSRDPAHGNATSPRIEQEARVGLRMQETGQLDGPIRRDPSGGAEFIDANGKPWDVKGYHSEHANGFDLGKVERDFTINMRSTNPEGLVVDTTNMSDAHIDQLRDLFSRRGWQDHLRWYP